MSDFQAAGGYAQAQAMVAAISASTSPRGRGRGSRGGGTSPRGRKIGVKLKRLDGTEYVRGGGGRGSRGGPGIRARKREGAFNSDYLYYMQQQQQQQSSSSGDLGASRLDMLIIYTVGRNIRYQNIYI